MTIYTDVWSLIFHFRNLTVIQITTLTRIYYLTLGNWTPCSAQNGATLYLTQDGLSLPNNFYKFYENPVKQQHNWFALFQDSGHTGLRNTLWLVSFNGVFYPAILTFISDDSKTSTPLNVYSVVGVSGD